LESSTSLRRSRFYPHFWTSFTASCCAQNEQSKSRLLEDGTDERRNA